MEFNGMYYIILLLVHILLTLRMVMNGTSDWSVYPIIKLQIYCLLPLYSISFRSYGVLLFNLLSINWLC